MSALQFRQDPRDLSVKLNEIYRSGDPDHADVGAEVIVNELVAHARHVAPRNLGMARAKI